MPHPSRRVAAIRRIALAAALFTAGLLLAVPTAQARIPAHLCAPFTQCREVLGPWVTAPPELDEIWEVDCPASNPIAVGADTSFRGVIYPTALPTGGGAPAPGTSELTFSVFPFNVSITFQPAAGCASAGGQLGVSPFGRAARAKPAYGRGPSVSASAPARPGA